MISDDENGKQAHGGLIGADRRDEPANLITQGHDGAARRAEDDAPLPTHFIPVAITASATA